METVVTITVEVGGPVWAAWMLTQGKMITAQQAEGPPSTFYALVDGRFNCSHTAGRKISGESFISLSEFLGADYRWREYKEPQGWDWAFAEMRAGRVVFDTRARVHVWLNTRGDFRYRYHSSQTAEWFPFSVKKEHLTEKCWIESDTKEGE